MDFPSPSLDPLSPGVEPGALNYNDLMQEVHEPALGASGKAELGDALAGI